MPTNSAAWINEKRATLKVAPAPYTTPNEDEIVIAARAVAVNPLDWIIQVAGNMAYRWLKYPTVLGSDVAGEVVEVGSKVTRFKKGDRVIGHAVGSDKDSNSAARGTFQNYVVVLERMASAIPSSLAFEDASVMPLALSTASCGLFQKDQLGMQFPTANAKPNGKTLLVWGGSTSVGSNAIQLAVAAGNNVIATSSPKNFEYVKSLGASQVFDYKSKSVVKEIVEAFKGKVSAGALAIGTSSAPACVQIIGQVEGNKFVTMATPAVSFDVLADENRKAFTQLGIIRKLITSNISLQVSARRRGVKVKFIFGTTLKANEVSHAIYQDFLPSALAEGRFPPTPRAKVVGKSLNDIQTAMDIQRRGVSASKVVVTLS